MDGVPSVDPDFIELRVRAEFLELCGDSETARQECLSSMAL